ncbi:MAG: hypothetical protein HYX67_06285 [Candidatus Melainabacteria bacterium]|nr:hypothetical protein [Candidatus Melainabacteria bacterium]
MTDRIFMQQDFAPDHNHVAMAASACLSDAQPRVFAQSGEKMIAANDVCTSKVGNPFYSLNRLDRLIAQETIRAVEKGDVKGVQDSLRMLAEIPKMQKSVMTGLKNYMEAAFPRTHVTWESGKNKDGTLFMHLQLERAHDDSKSSSYTVVEIGSDGTTNAYYTDHGNIFDRKTINAKDALCTMKFEKKDAYLPKLKIV